MQPLGPDDIVLAFGNSLTCGVGMDHKASYPAVLERLIGHKVIQAGVPGELTKQGLERLPNVLDQYHPALVILCHGGNDLLHKAGDRQAAENIRGMIRPAQERGAEVVLIGVPRPGLVLSSAGFYAKIAREFGLPYEGDILPEVLSKGFLKSDMIHPNAKGYQKLAEAVTALLKKQQAIP